MPVGKLQRTHCRHRVKRADGNKSFRIDNKYYDCSRAHLVREGEDRQNHRKNPPGSKNMFVTNETNDIPDLLLQLAAMPNMASVPSIAINTQVPSAPTAPQAEISMDVAHRTSCLHAVSWHGTSAVYNAPTTSEDLAPKTCTGARSKHCTHSISFIHQVTFDVSQAPMATLKFLHGHKSP